MFLRNFVASIYTPEGDSLPEYESKQIDDHTIECWIPSTEGANFEIWFWSLDPKIGLDLKCANHLDGISFGGRSARAEELAKGKAFKRKGKSVSRSTMRLFSFGSRTLTDREDIAPPKGGLQEELNSIRLTFTWGHAISIGLRNSFRTPQENNVIHEKAAKKGHAGSAGLGDTIRIDYQPKANRFEPTDGMEPVVFIFRYGPEEWLQARGIIPSENSTSLKRDRDPTPDLVDVDDFESDDDDVTIIKHMVPVAVAPSNKRRKIKGEADIKPESEDVKPKLEP